MKVELLFLMLLVFAIGCSPIKQYADAAQQWERDMEIFDSLSVADPGSDEAILFAGSSSIRLWDDIERDMSPYPVIRRGYGGAAYSDLAYFINRIVAPLSFKALVLFAGNDIWGRPEDRTPSEIRKLANYIIRQVSRNRPDLQIFIIEVTHVPAREHLVPDIDKQNQVLRSLCNRSENVHWIATRDIYLDEKNRVRRELFRTDEIHQNKLGYQLWTDAIKKELRLKL